MNSLNIISARVSPPASPAPSRSNSRADVRPSIEEEERSFATAILQSIKWMLSTLAAPGIYLYAYFDARRLVEPPAIKPAAHEDADDTRDVHEEIAPSRRSIRIKLHNEDSLRRRKPSDEVSAAIKSPTSPSLHLTRYPRAPAPPRPLIPRLPHQKKTLILDLDETLIHSMAKGGRMSSGHMVEVKLNSYLGVSGQTAVGPQHPILYYVHKRPYCDDFLRRVCKWYNLVVFTASVQEYADPVIDWLEQERKFFSGRFYRQHCTYRHGAFIKDLSSIEPDLSKVMILDNSPLSYMFHQDNAIPIEGWISDPTDNDLLHLVPLLEGLQYATDVRALLALRGGEDGKHMIA